MVNDAGLEVSTDGGWESPADEGDDFALADALDPDDEEADADDDGDAPAYDDGLATVGRD